MEESSSTKRKNDHDVTSNSDDSRRHKKSKKSSRKKKSRKKRHHRHDDQDSDSKSLSSSDESRHRRKDKKQKKHKKRKKHAKCDDDSDKDSAPRFGKYGILKRDDFSRMQRTLEVWLDEVKSISASVLSRRDLQTYFAEFCEDFNTATLPHKKFYNFDAWELAEWNKTKAASAAGQDKNDEFAHKAMRKQEEPSVKLDSETIADMKHQASLRTQMQVAFRTGDTEKYERLRNRLNAND